MTTTKSTRRSLTVFGDPVWVKLYQTTDGRHCCEWDDHHDGRRDLQTQGYGDTDQEAITAYVASCHKRNQLPPGYLY